MYLGVTIMACTLIGLLARSLLYLCVEETGADI
jgi:hypothetical protein